MEYGDIYQTIGQRLRELRKSLGLTQAEFGEIMGISAPSVVNYETGTRKVPIEMLLRFARFYGVSLDFLAGNAQEPPIDNCTVTTARYARLWREFEDITSDEAEQIFRFARFIISERIEND